MLEELLPEHKKWLDEEYARILNHKPTVAEEQQRKYRQAEKERLRKLKRQNRKSDRIPIGQSLSLASKISSNPQLRAHLVKQGYGKHVDRLCLQSGIFWWLMLTLAVFIGMLLR